MHVKPQAKGPRDGVFSEAKASTYRLFGLGALGLMVWRKRKK